MAVSGPLAGSRKSRGEGGKREEEDREGPRGEAPSDSDGFLVLVCKAVVNMIYDLKMVLICNLLEIGKVV